MHRPNILSLIKKQLLKNNVNGFVKTHDADKHCKGFNTLRHLLVMVYAQLSGANSLRDLVFTMNSHHSQHYHLGLDTVRRSTLSYANQHRPAQVFIDLLQSMIHQLGRKQKKEVKDLVLLLDSTPISLKGWGFDSWTRSMKTPRTQGFKVHIEYNLTRSLPTFFEMTPANVNDICIAKKIALQENATYVFDKGYCDYDWWLSIDQANACFVTRLKNNAAIRLIQQKVVTEDASQIIEEDAIIGFRNKNPRAGKKLNYTKPLRCIKVKRQDKAPLVLITNDLNRDALEVAELYKSRWLIELFFKWIKQHLKIKRFIGQNENAVKIQIITALIAYILVVSLHQMMPAYGTLKEMLLTIRTCLFHHFNFEKPPPMRRKKATAIQRTLRFKEC